METVLGGRSILIKNILRHFMGVLFFRQIALKGAIFALMINPPKRPLIVRVSSLRCVGSPLRRDPRYPILVLPAPRLDVNRWFFLQPSRLTKSLKVK